jgi:hypothetical protein
MKKLDILPILANKEFKGKRVVAIYNSSRDMLKRKIIPDGR